MDQCYCQQLFSRVYIEILNGGGRTPVMPGKSSLVIKTCSKNLPISVYVTLLKAGQTKNLVQPGLNVILSL